MSNKIEKAVDALLGIESRPLTEEPVGFDWEKVVFEVVDWFENAAPDIARSMRYSGKRMTGEDVLEDPELIGQWCGDKMMDILRQNRIERTPEVWDKFSRAVAKEVSSHSMPSLENEIYSRLV